MSGKARREYQGVQSVHHPPHGVCIVFYKGPSHSTWWWPLWSPGGNGSPRWDGSEGLIATAMRKSSRWRLPVLKGPSLETSQPFNYYLSTFLFHQCIHVMNQAAARILSVRGAKFEWQVNRSIRFYIRFLYYFENGGPHLNPSWQWPPVGSIYTLGTRTLTGLPGW